MKNCLLIIILIFLFFILNNDKKVEIDNNIYDNTIINYIKEKFNINIDIKPIINYLIKNKEIEFNSKVEYCVYKYSDLFKNIDKNQVISNILSIIIFDEAFNNYDLYFKDIKYCLEIKNIDKIISNIFNKNIEFIELYHNILSEFVKNIIIAQCDDNISFNYIYNILLQKLPKFKQNNNINNIYKLSVILYSFRVAYIYKCNI